MPLPGSGPVQQASNSAAGISALQVTLSAPATANKLLLVVSSPDVPTGVAGLGATWARLTNGVPGHSLEWWIGTNPSGAGGNVTVSWAASQSFASVYATEWANLEPAAIATDRDWFDSATGNHRTIFSPNNNVLLLWGYDAVSGATGSGYTALSTGTTSLRVSYRVEAAAAGVLYGVGYQPGSGTYSWAVVVLQGSPLAPLDLAPGPHPGPAIGGGIASLSGADMGTPLVELALYSGSSPTTRLAGLYRAHNINWRDALTETGSGSFQLPRLPLSTIAIDTNVVNTNRTGNLLVVTGSTRTLFPSCDITIPPVATITVGWDVWWSHNNSGTAFKRETLTIRRDTVNGAVLATFTGSATNDEGNSATGHQFNWTGSTVDPSPTTGRYVVAIQEVGTNTANTQLWSDARTFILGVDVAQPTEVPLADNIVRCHVNGRILFAFLADAPTHTVASSDGEAGESWTVAGRGMEAYLDREQWYPPGWGTGGPNFPTKVTGTLTGGGWLRRFVDEAKVRGGLPALTTDFSSSVDSAGVAWSTTLALEFAVGTRGLALVDELRRNGITVRVTEGLVLRAWEAYGEHRETSVVLRQGAHIREAVPVAYGTSELRTRMLVQGLEVSGLAPFTEIADTVLETPDVGRRAGFTTGDGRTALDAAQATTTSIPVALLTGLEPGQYLPGYHFNVGDYVGLDIPGTFEQSAQRVVAVVVSQTGSDSVPRFDVTLGSSRRHPLLDLASRVGKLER